MTLLLWLLAGVVVGGLARKIIPKLGNVNWMFAGLIALIGACVGGFASALSGLSNGNLVMETIVAVAGAVIVLIFYRQFLTDSSGNVA